MEIKLMIKAFIASLLTLIVSGLAIIIALMFYALLWLPVNLIIIYLIGLIEPIENRFGLMSVLLTIELIPSIIIYKLTEDYYEDYLREKRDSV